MNGQAIAAQAIAHAGPRLLASELIGPRPGGARGDAVHETATESRAARAASDTRTAMPPPEPRTSAAKRP